MERSKYNKNKFIIPLVIGILIVLCSLVMVIAGVKEYSNATKQYNIELDEYENARDKWFKDPFNNDKPVYPGLGPSMPFEFFAGVGLFFVSIPCFMFSFSQLKKSKKQLATEKRDFLDRDESTFTTFVEKKTNLTCAYCGAPVDEEKSKCDSCGASVKKK